MENNEKVNDDIKEIKDELRALKERVKKLEQPTDSHPFKIPHPEEWR